MGVVLVVVVAVAVLLGWAALVDWKRRRRLRANDDLPAQLRAHHRAEGTRYHASGGSG